jgi:putative transposase
MSEDRYRRNNGAVYTLKFHIVWCPKYRRKILTGAIEADLRVLLAEKAVQLDVLIEAIEVMPDHVHLFVSAPPTLPVAQLVNHFKGFTSRRLMQKFPMLKRQMRVVWSRSYYAGSVGHVSEETVKAYIANQKDA